MAEGWVKRFDESKGVGIIAAEDGAEVFVHFSAVKSEGFKSLSEGDRVAYDVVAGPRGVQAVNVTKLG